MLMSPEDISDLWTADLSFFSRQYVRSSSIAAHFEKVENQTREKKENELERLKNDWRAISSLYKRVAERVIERTESNFYSENIDSSFFLSPSPSLSLSLSCNFFFTTNITMTSNDRRASLSPGERSRVKSQSSSRSQRTTPNLIVHDEDGQQRKASSRTSQRTTKEIDPSKRSESSASTRSTKTPTPTSAKSIKQRSSVRTPTNTSPTGRRRSSSKRKKSLISVTELERQQILEQNDSEKQNLTGSGFAMVPPEIFLSTYNFNGSFVSHAHSIYSGHH